MDMELSILPPTDDWIFKLIFGDERHKDNTIALLKSFLDLPGGKCDITFMDPILKPEAEDDKMGIVDVKLNLNDKDVYSPVSTMLWRYGYEN
jgi:hypothetical protein